MIRRATVDDLDTIVALDQAAFVSDAWSRSMMQSELESPHSYYLVQEEAGRAVAYAGLRAPTGSRDADVQTIGVAADGRSRGRGRTLLRALLDEAARRRVKDVFLDVRVDNDRAIALYTSEGFVDIGRRRGYYQPDDVDAIVMRLDLAGWTASRRDEYAPHRGDAVTGSARDAADSSNGTAAGSWCT